MAIIITSNNLHVESPKTFVSVAGAAGATTGTVQNTAGLTTSWAIQYGEVGGENSEVLIGTPATGTTITHPATSFSHPQDTPVYFIKFNQVVFERSTTGTAGTATPMTDGTVTYQADSTTTIFDDTSGSSTYAYRTYFRNSVLEVNSTESAWQTFAGFPFYSLGNIRNRIKERLWNANWLTDAVIDNWVNEWKEELTNEAIKSNEDYALGSVNVAFGTDGLGTVTTADFHQPRRVWVTYNGANWYNSIKMNVNDYYPDETFTSLQPYHAWIGYNVFIVKPSDSPGTAGVIFYRAGTPLVNDTDEIPNAMKPYTKSFVDYGVAQASFKDGKIQEYRDMTAMSQAGKQNFIANLAPRDKSSPTMIDIVSPISGDDIIW